MKPYYDSYLRAFHSFAQLALKNKLVTTITRFALIINLHANKLIYRATLNKMVMLPTLQKAILEAGRAYIHKFSDRLKLEKVIALKRVRFD